MGMRQKTKKIKLNGQLKKTETFNSPNSQSFFRENPQSTFIKFIHSEKAKKFCKIFNLLLTGNTQDKSKMKISQNHVAFSEYMNFNTEQLLSARLWQFDQTRKLCKASYHAYNHKGQFCNIYLVKEQQKVKLVTTMTLIGIISKLWWKNMCWKILI